MAGRFAKISANTPRMWHLVDAKEQVRRAVRGVCVSLPAAWLLRMCALACVCWFGSQVVGRLATQVARLLIGKHKPTYVPHIDGGDYVVVVNAKHAALTGKKFTDKLYHWHTGYPGGLKTLTARQLWERAPERILTKAVKGMLPRNRLHKPRLKRLRVFSEEEHLHEANLRWAQQYAPGFLEHCLPEDVRASVRGGEGGFVEDVPLFDDNGVETELGPEIGEHPDFDPENPDFDVDAFLAQLEAEEAAMRGE